MRIRSTPEPVFFGREHTRSLLLHSIACHKFVRHNVIPTHTMPVHQLAVVESGELGLVVGGRPMTVAGGHVGVIAAGTPIADGGGLNIAKVYWVGLKPLAARDLTSDPRRRQRLEELERLLVRASGRVLRAGEALPAAVAEAFRLVWEGGANELVLQSAADAVAGRVYELLTAPEPDDDAERRALAPALREIDRHYAEHLFLEDLAEACGMSTTRLNQAFKRVTGLTPRRYVNLKRVQQACELLADPRRTVTEVAQAVGFTTSQYFASVFRKFLGCSPRQFRDQRGRGI